MTDRAGELLRFCHKQDAVGVYVLTVLSPFRASQDRYVLADHGRDATLLVCSNCPLESPLCEGQLYPISPSDLAEFRRRLDAIAHDWQDEVVSPDSHDGVTYILEHAQGLDYRRVRMVTPPDKSAQACLLAAWRDSFPVVRRRMH
jgi:hypothetical protein